MATVDIFGVFTGLTERAFAGLQLRTPTSFSDVFGFDNDGLVHANNFAGIATVLTATPVSGTRGEDLLTIEGNSPTPLALDIFLDQEKGVAGFAKNLSFTELNLTADQFGGNLLPPVESVPEPNTLAVFGFGLIGMAMTRRRRGTCQAAMPSPA